MNAKEENICRLCLKVAENGFEIINEITREMFDILLLKVNLDIIKDPIICKDCAELAEKCFNFKAACSDTEEIIFSFAIGKNCSTFELKDIYKDGQDMKTVDEDSICRFCMNQFIGENCVLLDKLMEDVTIAEMLLVLLPEMNFNIIKNPLICISCKRHLEFYIKFVENYLAIEEKVTKYYQNEGTAEIKLSDLLSVMFKNGLKSDYTQIDTIKQEALEDIEEAYSEKYLNELIKVEEIDIKNEAVTPSKRIPSEIKIEKAYQMEHKAKANKKNDKLNTMNVSEVEIDKHGLCNFEENHNNDLVNHISIRNNITRVELYKCSMCSYQAKHKSYLKSHMLVHKDIREVKMYKCSMCTHETRHKRGLKTHMLIHKDITEVEMYKCSMCTYQAKYKCSLRTHMLTHKDITEVKVYKCSICTYQAKRNDQLKSHMLTHKDITEVKMYKCQTCTYQAKQKGALKTHIMLIHKDITEMEMYKCSTCTYQAKQKSTLKRHMLVHKDITEVETYKCWLCTYQAKQKSALKTHIMLIHKDITEVEMYKCSTCTYQAKQKSTLRRHMLIHKDITEVKTYKCSLCTYRAKQKCALKRHIMLIHKDITEVEMYKCSMCTYQAKQKSKLKRHILVYKHYGGGNV